MSGWGFALDEYNVTTLPLYCRWLGEEKMQDPFCVQLIRRDGWTFAPGEYTDFNGDPDGASASSPADAVPTTPATSSPTARIFVHRLFFIVDTSFVIGVE